MNITPIVEKHTGHRIDHRVLEAASDSDDRLGAQIAEAVLRAADDLAHTDQELARTARSIHATTARVCHAVTAVGAEDIYPINPRGELQAEGPRLDVLIAVRDERIRYLRTLVRLWLTYRDPSI